MVEVLWYPVVALVEVYSHIGDGMAAGINSRYPGWKR